MTIPIPKNDPPFICYYEHHCSDGACVVVFVTREYILKTYEPSQHALTDDDVIAEFIQHFDAKKI